MDRGNIKTEILVRSGKTTTSAWTSEAYLNDWINQAHRWAAGFKPWPYTEGRTQTTYTGVEEINFEGYRADSFRFIQIGGKRLQKINFEHYQKFREEQPGSSDKVYSDFGNLVYINPNTGLSGTLVAYGQFMPAYIDDGDEMDLVETVFSPRGDEGNEAIIEKALSGIEYRDGNKDQAQMREQNARMKLEELWKRIQDEQYAYHSKDVGMFGRIDVVNGGLADDLLNTNQF